MGYILCFVCLSLFQSTGDELDTFIPILRVRKLMLKEVLSQNILTSWSSTPGIFSLRTRHLRPHILNQESIILKS